jgi:hypothetical protein
MAKKKPAKKTPKLRPDANDPDAVKRGKRPKVTRKR